MTLKEIRTRDSARREQFCQEYSVSLNATQAAIKAGYAQKNAGNIASKLLDRDDVRARIAELREETARNLQITKEKVLAQYARLAFRDVKGLYDENGLLKSVHEFDENNAAAVVGIESVEVLGVMGTIKKVKMSDPKAALDSIAKLLGFNAPEKVDHTTKGEKITDKIDYSKLSLQTLQELRAAIKLDGDDDTA